MSNFNIDAARRLRLIATDLVTKFSCSKEQATFCFTCVAANYVSFVARKFVLSGHAGVRDTLTFKLRLKRGSEGQEGGKEESDDPLVTARRSAVNEFNTRGCRFRRHDKRFPAKLEQLEEKMAIVVQLRMSVTRPIDVLLLLLLRVLSLTRSPPPFFSRERCQLKNKNNVEVVADKGVVATQLLPRSLLPRLFRGKTCCYIRVARLPFVVYWLYFIHAIRYETNVLAVSAG